MSTTGAIESSVCTNPEPTSTVEGSACLAIAAYVQHEVVTVDGVAATVDGAVVTVPAET